MKLGAMEHLLGTGDDTAKFRQAKRLGLAGVEVTLTRADLADDGRLKRLKNAKSASGLKIPSIVLMEHNRGGIASADSAVAEAAREDIRRALPSARKLGAKVVLVPFFAQGEITSDADFQRAADGFRELCKLAASCGLKLCFEGTLSAGRIRQMAEQVQSEAFGCYFDLANVVWRGMDTATEIRALGPLISQVHMKECRVGPGDCRPGLGRVNYQESAKALREIKYNGWIVLETPTGPTELICRDISFTGSVFPRVRSSEPWPKLGAFSYGFESGQLDRLIEGFKAAGLSRVQLGGGLLEDAFKDPPAIRSRLEESGIFITALAGYKNLVAPDESKRRSNLDHLKRCLEIAPHLGTSVVATETGTRHPESDWTAVPENWGEAAWTTLYAALDELLPVAEKSGAILALECYVNNVAATHGQLHGVLEKYLTPHLQVVLDPFNYLSKHLLAARERITAEFLDRFEHRFVLAHLKDVSPDGAEVSTPEFGEGVFPHKLYLEFLRKRRPDLPIILEHLPFDHIPAAIERLRSLIDA